MSRVGASHVFTATVCSNCDGLIDATMTPPSNTSEVIGILLMHRGWCKCESHYTYSSDDEASFLDLID